MKRTHWNILGALLILTLMFGAVGCKGGGDGGDNPQVPKSEETE